MSTKAVLKQFFLTGRRPKQMEFEDLIDSFVSIVETNTGSVTFTGGVIIGNTSVPALPGAIRWTGANFEFHNGAGFQPLTLGGGISNPQDIGNVRIGSTLAGAVAAFAHSTKYTNNDFAFGQAPGGNTIVSSGTTILFQNRVLNTPTNVMRITGNKAIVETDLTIGPLPTVATTLLTVNGDAQKANGSAWLVISDARMKKDIYDFSEGLNKLLQVNPVRFKYKNSADLSDSSAEQVGVLAHEIQSIFPYMIKEIKGKLNEEDEAETELLSFNSSSLQYVIINSIKELNQRIDALEQSLNKLNN